MKMSCTDREKINSETTKQMGVELELPENSHSDITTEAQETLRDGC